MTEVTMEDEKKSLPSTDSGHVSVSARLEGNGTENVYAEAFNETGSVGSHAAEDDVGEKSEDYKKYTHSAVEMAEENMFDRERPITNPGWHHDKPGWFQTPLDMNSKQCVPDFGLEGETCCERTAIFCGKLCGCPNEKTLRIGAIRILARVVMALLVWGYAWSITFPPCVHSDAPESNNTGNGTSKDDPCILPGLPGSSLFGILMVFLFGMVAEALIVLIPLPWDLPPLPPLLGSLVVGIILRNVPGIKVGADIDDLVSSKLRNMALGIILGRAGLEVDKKQMYILRWVVPRLAFLPCIIEACSYGIFAHLILGLPYQWSFLLGFVCGAVAPACVVPSMIKFQEQGLGTDHGVPSLLIAGASIDDIVAINVFNILLEITLGDGSTGVWHGIGIACAEVTLGIIAGVAGGIFLQKVPDRRQHNIIRDRTFLLVAISFFYIFASDEPIGLAGAGTLGTLVCSFVAALGWYHHQAEAVAHNFKAIWFYFQPLLFGLTGATVDISQMDGHTVGLAIITMLICLAIRLTVAGNAVSFLGWSHKEKFMTAVSWIPKATVQAAIGGVALSKVNIICADVFELNPSQCNNYNKFDGNVSLCEPGPNCYCEGTREDTCYLEEGYALIILQVSVILIMITAPVGVFLIGLAGPKLLPQCKIPGKEDDPEANGSEGDNVSVGAYGVVLGGLGREEDAVQEGQGKFDNYGYSNDEKGDPTGNTRL